MDLFSVLLNIGQFPEQDTLYVEQPWTLESQTQVIELDPAAPFIQMNERVFTYFLEVSIIDELSIQFDQQNLCLLQADYRVSSKTYCCMNSANLIFCCPAGSKLSIVSHAR